MSALAHRSLISQFSSKNEQSSTDECSEIAQRWKDMMTFHGHSLAEKYAHGRIAFVCDLHASLISWNDKSASLGNSPLGNRELFASFVYVADIANPLKLKMGNDEPMFVLNVETVESPEGITIPSLVGLYRPHDVVDDPFRGLTFQSSLDGSFKVIPCLVYRENYIVRPLASGQEFDFTHGNVESTSKIVDGVADDTHNLFRDRWTRNKFERIVAGIRLTVHVNTVSVVGLKDVTLKVSDVLSGPFDL
jgi:hypothetical protein